MPSLRQNTTAAARTRVTVGLSLVVLGLATWFLWPAARRTWPHAPLPLDDAYIHLDYARSFTLRQPFAWLPGQGYSSGETAPLYALLLTVPAHLGLDGDALAWTATALGVAGIVFGVWQWACILGRAWPAALVFVSVGFALWSLLSGMELGVYFALFSWTLRAADRHRLRAVSLGLAGLVALRPEALLLALLLSAGIAGGAQRRLCTFVRLLAPAVLVQSAVFAANRWLTGELQSAGAILKLVSENPGLDAGARLREVLTNLITSYFGAFSRSTRTPSLHLLLGGCLAACAFGSRQRRGWMAALALAVPLTSILVSFNATARYQGFRYYVPALLAGCALVAFGLRAIAAHTRAVALPLCAVLVGLGAVKLPVYREHFAKASGNIAEQQVAVGLRLGASTAPDARLLLGDAGALPYFSRRSAIDALGLGGFRGMPFVRAATFGEAATLELIERLPPAERPTHLALYASWFPETTRHFGHPWFAVGIEDNVICGAPIKSVYHADWSSMGHFVPEAFASRWEPARLLDTVDFADPISERQHQLRLEGQSAYVVEVREEDAARRFDGCRQLAPDAELHVLVQAPDGVAPSAQATTFGLRGVDLEGFRYRVTPRARVHGELAQVAEAVAGGWRASPLEEHRWQLAEAELVPRNGATHFLLDVLASARGGRVCHLWWRAISP